MKYFNSVKYKTTNVYYYNNKIPTHISLLSLCLVSILSVVECQLCTVCPANSYCSGPDITACPTNSNSSYGSEFITDCKCQPGYVGENGGICIECATDSFCIGGNSTKRCPDNMAGPMGSNSQTYCTCQPGWYGKFGEECVMCTTGWFCHADVKTQCPTNSVSVAGSDEQSDCVCIAGYTRSDDGLCVECTAGTYKDMAGSMSCIVCDRGTYSYAMGATSTSSCSQCSFETTSEPGSTRLDHCQCSVGYIGDYTTGCAMSRASSLYKVVFSITLNISIEDFNQSVQQDLIIAIADFFQIEVSVVTIESFSEVVHRRRLLSNSILVEIGLLVTRTQLTGVTELISNGSLTSTLLSQGLSATEVSTETVSSISQPTRTITQVETLLLGMMNVCNCKR